MRQSFYTVVQACALLIVATLVLGAVLGQPVALSYVETGSMAPTIDPGDGFVAVPSAIAGSVETGDVVVFRAKRLHGGGLTTHRVVEETEEGFITRGDSNPSTDQSGTEPPVKDAQIVAQALQIGGTVVVIPNLGTLVVGVQGWLGSVQQRFAGVFGLGGQQAFAALLLAVCVLGYAGDVWRERSTTTRSRERSHDQGIDPRFLVLGMCGLVVLASTAAMVVPSGPTEYAFVSSSYDTPGASVIGVGDTEQTGYRIDNTGLFPIVTFLETEGSSVSVSPAASRVSAGDAVDARVTLTAPPETGYYRRFVVEHRYLAILPASTIHTLYKIHAWLPIVVIDALVGVPFYLLGIRLIGSGRIRTRSRERTLSPLTRLRRVFTESPN